MAELHIALTMRFLDLYREVGWVAKAQGENWRLENPELMDAYQAAGEALEEVLKWPLGKNGS